jgi:hypothetical protein
MIARSLFAVVFACALCGAGQLFADVPSEEEKSEGFVSLFDGKSLDGWIGDTEGYAVENGAIVCIPDRGGNVFTKGEYADFVLRFEFKMEPGANNGLGIRAPTDQGDVAYTGMELQILDDGHETYKDIRDYQAHGSVYGIVAAKRGFLKPAAARLRSC